VTKATSIRDITSKDHSVKRRETIYRLLSTWKGVDTSNFPQILRDNPREGE